MEHEHTPEAIRARLAEGPKTSYLRDFVYGGIDGSVTTFAIVTGVAGAQLSSTIILILGVANLVGDGFSMAASNYSATAPGRLLTLREPHHDGPRFLCIFSTSDRRLPRHLAKLLVGHPAAEVRLRDDANQRTL